MEPLDHPDTLRMKQGCCRGQDSERRTDSGPDGGGKLSSLSEVRTARTPNLETHIERKAQTQDSAETEANWSSCQSLSKENLQRS